MPIVVRIDVELAKRKMSVGEFAERVGLTPANVAVLKNGRAKAVRFSTLEAMCRVLDCQPGDLLEWVEDAASPWRVWSGNRSREGERMKYLVAILVFALGVAASSVAGMTTRPARRCSGYCSSWRSSSACGPLGAAGRGPSRR